MAIQVDREKILRLTSSLVKIPSENPPGNEGEVADYLESEMRKAGFKIFRYDFKPGRPNLIGRLKAGDGGTIIFDGHMDTVPAGNPDLWITKDPFSGEIIDGRLYGRGSADMKSSIAAFLSAVETLLDKSEIEGEVLVFLVSDEEASGLGTRDILSRGYTGDMAVVGEPTGLKVMIAHKGVVRWRLSTFGKSAHSSSPERGINAIYKMAKACLELKRLSEKLHTRRDSLLGSPTMSINMIRGGEKDNVIPDFCEVLIDRRLVPGEELGEVESDLINILEGIKGGDKEFQYRLERYQYIPPSMTKPDANIVRLMKEAVREVMGVEPKVSGFKATCEMVHLMSSGVPTVIFGSGKLEQAHEINEYVEVEEIVKAAEIYAHLIINATKHRESF
jgi:acetylornithine deacetylase/succinyl-diaminopimelate desuccinylase family protein